MKVLKVYYKGTCQELSVADGTSSDEIFEVLKRVFRINENLDNFFFQDSEGRIVILPKILPKELSLFLYVRQDIDSSSFQAQTAPSNQQAPDLKWKFICTKGTEQQLINGIRYYPTNNPTEGQYPSIISSINFSQGKHFTVIKLDSHGCGWVGLGLPGSPPEYFNPGWHCGCKYSGLPESKLPTFIRIGESECDQLTKLTGIVIDCDSKIGYFVQVNPETFSPLKIILKVTDLPESILIFAGAKAWSCIPQPHTGITLVKDSLPYPNLSNLVPQKTISWITDQEHKV